MLILFAEKLSGREICAVFDWCAACYCSRMSCDLLELGCEAERFSCWWSGNDEARL